jgi:ABC-type branched-subunit amino acid transport system permease subunit
VSVSRSTADLLGWFGALAFAVAFPLLIGTPYYVSIGITALIFITLAVSFDLVVGRIGALSLAQPLFFGFGAYVGALLSAHFNTSFWLEITAAAAAGAVLAVVIGIPSFRLSLHSFAIGTLGFAVIGQIVAQNWVSVTRGPLCVTGIQTLRLPFLGGGLAAVSLEQQYFVILAIASLTVGIVYLITRLRLNLAFTAVRDDPLLASARGLWPLRFRLGAFSLSAACSATAGVFAAHFQTVICPDSLDFSYMTALLIMVFIGGRASLRGVVAGAIAFTIVPELLRVTVQWRLAIYGLVLLVVVTTFPDGLEHLFSRAGRQLSSIRRGLHAGDAPHAGEPS